MATPPTALSHPPSAWGRCDTGSGHGHSCSHPHPGLRVRQRRRGTDWVRGQTRKVREGAERDLSHCSKPITCQTCCCRPGGRPPHPQHPPHGGAGEHPCGLLGGSGVHPLEEHPYPFEGSGGCLCGPHGGSGKNSFEGSGGCLCGPHGRSGGHSCTPHVGSAVEEGMAFDWDRNHHP